MRMIRVALVIVSGLVVLSASAFFAGRVSWATSVPSHPSEVLFQNQGEGQSPDSGSIPVAQEQGAHMDHKAKHGGTFFMSLDNKHHLEGVLLPPGTFRVYLYDDHTRPLKAEETKQAVGTVQIGDSEDAPKINLGPGKKKEALEVSLGDAVKFPVTLTLLLHLPGMAPDAKPELFNFKFTQFTDERGPGTCTPMPKMNMSC